MSENWLARTAAVIGWTGVKQLQQAHIAVLGLGGVGSFAVEALARSGIGMLTLVDHDIVAETNLNRQLFALRSTIGRAKVSVARARVADINPYCNVIAHQTFFQTGTESLLWDDPPAVVLDAMDTVAAKVALILAGRERGVPVVSAMGAGNRSSGERFHVADIADTHTCPLARAVRVSLRKHGVTSGVPVVFSPETPQVAPVLPGSTAFVPPAVGLLLAEAAVRFLLEGRFDP